MFDGTLVKILKEMVTKEKKIKRYKGKLRVRGKILKKSMTKKNNIKLTIRRGNAEFSFIIIKSHKDTYAMAERLRIDTSVSIDGYKRMNFILCTKLKPVLRSVDIDTKQLKLSTWS